MPYVHFDSPGSRQCSPTSAACWSTLSPLTAQRRAERVGPADLLRAADDIGEVLARRRPKAAQASSDQARRPRSRSIVLEAVVASVT